jgi:hypothetical protein
LWEVAIHALADSDDLLGSNAEVVAAGERGGFWFLPPKCKWKMNVGFIRIESYIILILILKHVQSVVNSSHNNNHGHQPCIPQRTPPFQAWGGASAAKTSSDWHT